MVIGAATVQEAAPVKGAVAFGIDAEHPARSREFSGKVETGFPSKNAINARNESTFSFRRN